MLSLEVRRAIYDGADGKCHVCGAAVHALDKWSAVEGKLLDQPCDSLRGNRTLDEFRGHLLARLEAAEALAARYRHLRGGIEAGERKLLFADERNDGTRDAD